MGISISMVCLRDVIRYCFIQIMHINFIERWCISLKNAVPDFNISIETNINYLYSVNIPTLHPPWSCLQYPAYGLKVIEKQ